MSNLFTLRIWAILLLSAGYGWAGGHFIPADASPSAYVFQFTILLMLLILATGFLRASALVANFTTAATNSAAAAMKSPSRIRRNIIGLNIYAALTLVINLTNIIRGASAGSQYGSHNTFADLVPIALIMSGDILWLVTNGKLRTFRPNRLP